MICPFMSGKYGHEPERAEDKPELNRATSATGRSVPVSNGATIEAPKDSI